MIFSADNHLGKHYARMTPEQLGARRRRLREAWAETVSFALQNDAAVYLHGGDLFDTASPRTAELVWVARQFERLRDAGVHIYAIGGNHDVPRSTSEGATPLRIFHELRVAHVFTRPSEVEWEIVEADGVRLAIGGLAPDPTLGYGDDPLDGVEGLSPPPGVDHAILMMHYGVEGTMMDDVNEAIISKGRIAALAPIDLLLVGHVHERSVQTVGEVKVAFSGPTERMTFGEHAVKPGFIEVRADRDRLEVKYHDIAGQPMHRNTVRTTDLPPEEPTEHLLDYVRAYSREGQLFQLRLEGPMSMAAFRDIRWWDVRNLGNSLNFYFDLDRHGVYLVREDNLPMGLGGERVSPTGEIETVASLLLAETEDADEQSLIREARDMVLRRYGGDS
ncbi:MAG: DNA repair exonuclease [Anaerolineae bacterium]